MRTLPIADSQPLEPLIPRTAKSDIEVLPELALRLGRVLRSGVTVEVALAEVDDDMAGRHRNLRTAAHHVSSGRPLAVVLGEWLHHAGSDAEQLMVGAVLAGIESGADLANVIDSIGEALRDDVEHDRRRRILLTQAQMSAAVLVLLPPGFALISSIARGVPYSGTAGWVFLGGGIVLDVLGLIWIRRLLRRLR